MSLNELTEAWRVEIGGRLTQPVVADGMLLVAAIDAHTLHALDARTGRTRWQFVAGARIDSPPSVAQGLAVFGCRDGWVYALRCADGQLAWRWRAAPSERQLVDNGQLESAWPDALHAWRCPASCPTCSPARVSGSGCGA